MLRVLATSNATGIPPRGRPSTMTSLLWANWLSREARTLPASVRSRNSIGKLLTAYATHGVVLRIDRVRARYFQPIPRQIWIDGRAYPLPIFFTIEAKNLAATHLG